MAIMFVSYIKKTALSIAALAVALSWSPLATSAFAQSVQRRGGGIAATGPARAVVLSALPEAAGTSTGHSISQLSPFNPEQLAALKAQGREAAHAANVNSGPVLAPQTNGAQTVGASINFGGLQQNTAACGDWTPGDQALAIGDGSNPILQAVNLCLAVYSPAGAVLKAPVALSTFFGIGSSTIISDPRALYDWYNHRFIVTLLDCTGSPATQCYYDVGVSQTDDPTGAWWTYHIPTPTGGGVLNDFPRVGQDITSPFPGQTAYPGAIYLASNLYSLTTNAYLKEEWLILSKYQLYNGLGYNFWYFSGITNPDGSNSFTSQPANTWNPYERPRAEFFLESFAFGVGANKLVAWAVSNPFGYITGGPGPELTGFEFNTVNAYSIPSNPVTGLIDARISGEVTYNAGYIYGSLTSQNGSGGNNFVVYKVRPVLNTNDSRCTGAYVNLCPQITGASIADETVYNAGSAYAFYGTPQPDEEDNVTTVFSYSSAGSSVPALAYVQQRVTAGSAFSDGGFFLIGASGPYTQGRWGDYTAVAPAGIRYVSGGAVSMPGAGFSGMYAVTGSCFGPNTGCWKTQIGYTLYSLPSQQ
jgi:hypothetical protein